MSTVVSDGTTRPGILRRSSYHCLSCARFPQTFRSAEYEFQPDKIETMTILWRIWDFARPTHFSQCRCPGMGDWCRHVNLENCVRNRSMIHKEQYSTRADVDREGLSFFPWGDLMACSLPFFIIFNLFNRRCNFVWNRLHHRETISMLLRTHRDRPGTLVESTPYKSHPSPH